MRYFPKEGKFVPDAFVNIVDVGNGTFRMTDRYNGDWWDGDRDTTNRDRQRAEVKGLGPHQKDGQTFEYATTWRLSSNFRGTAGFCHLFQLKAVNGDSGAPLVTMSIHGDHVTIEANPAGQHFVAREFPWKPGVWQTVCIRITTSPDSGVGALLASVNGDAFQGRQKVALMRPGANEYRPKWGLYRKATVDAPMGDNFVEHRDVSAREIGVPLIDNAPLERDARQRAGEQSPERALAWLETQPVSPARDFVIASMAALWAETAPGAAMAWVERLPEGALRSDATERVFSRWAGIDTPAAIRWVRSRVPQAPLDPLLWLLATDTTYRYVNRPIALDAATWITNSALRAKAFEHVVLIWARRQPDEARTFVEKLTVLTPTQRDELVTEIRTHRTPWGTPVSID